MNVIAGVAVAVVAGLQIFFLVLEIFLWRKPLGMRIFQMTPDVAAISSPLAANQGLYNGFLAAGLIWGLVAGVSELEIQVFFLVCVVIAGVFGSVTAKRSILWFQALPGAVALALVALAHAR
jgi:putative membrane protein